MGFLGFFKKGPPDLRTLGKWLWNNDVDALEQVCQNANVSLFRELVESGVITVASGNLVSKADEVEMTAGHLTNLLDGGYLFSDYEPKTKDVRLINAAERTRDLILSGEYPQLSALSLMVGALLAIRLWYALRLEECLKVASHVISIAGEKGAAESYRVRGFAYFALGDYQAAFADMLEAQRIEPGLVGINEPLKALAKLTNSSPPRDYEPAGIAVGRTSLRTFSQILKLGAIAAGGAPQPNPLFDFGGRAQEVDSMIKSGVLARPKLTTGDVADLAKCAMSAKLALTEYLLPTWKPGQASSLPTTQEIRDAFGHCVLYLAGTQSINRMTDPAFANVVEGFSEAVESLFARLDESKFDLP